MAAKSNKKLTADGTRVCAECVARHAISCMQRRLKRKGEYEYVCSACVGLMDEISLMERTKAAAECVRSYMEYDRFRHNRPAINKDLSSIRKKQSIYVADTPGMDVMKDPQTNYAKQIESLLSYKGQMRVSQIANSLACHGYGKYVLQAMASTLSRMRQRGIVERHLGCWRLVEAREPPRLSVGRTRLADGNNARVIHASAARRVGWERVTDAVDAALSGLELSVFALEPEDVRHQLICLVMSGELAVSDLPIRAKTIARSMSADRLKFVSHKDWMD